MFPFYTFGNFLEKNTHSLLKRKKDRKHTKQNLSERLQVTNIKYPQLLLLIWSRPEIEQSDCYGAH